MKNFKKAVYKFTNIIHVIYLVHRRQLPHLQYRMTVLFIYNMSLWKENIPIQNNYFSIVINIKAAISYSIIQIIS